MLDPEWPTFRKIQSDTVSLRIAEANIERIQEFCSKHKAQMASAT